MDDGMQQQFLQLYARAFPGREHARIDACSSITDGWESDIFVIRLAYEEAAGQHSQEIVLKIYHGQSGVGKARDEAYGLKQLAYGGYPVPALLFVSLEESALGRACVAMEKIDGRTLTEIIYESSQEKQHELIMLFCQLYVRLHALDWRPLVPDPEAYQAEERMLSRVTGMQSSIERLLPGVFDCVFGWLQERVAGIEKRDLSVIHGDFHPSNVLLRADGSACVIDWTGVDIADYRFDLAWTLLLLSTEVASTVSAEFRAALRGIVLEGYERFAGRAVEDIEFFDVVACLRRLSDIAASLGNGAETMGMKAGAEANMREGVHRLKRVYALLQERTGCTLPEIERLIQSLS